MRVLVVNPFVGCSSSSFEDEYCGWQLLYGVLNIVDVLFCAPSILEMSENGLLFEKELDVGLLWHEEEGNGNFSTVEEVMVVLLYSLASVQS